MSTIRSQLWLNFYRQFWMARIIWVIGFFFLFLFSYFQYFLGEGEERIVYWYDHSIKGKPFSCTHTCHYQIDIFHTRKIRRNKNKNNSYTIFMSHVFGRNTNRSIKINFITLKYVINNVISKRGTYIPFLWGL